MFELSFEREVDVGGGDWRVYEGERILWLKL